MSEEYEIIDPKVFPDHVLREDTDWCRFDTSSGSCGKTWNKVKGLKGKRVQEHCRDYSFRCLKKDHPATTASQTVKPIVIAASKTYLTAGGYVVQTILHDGCINATKETSPGVSGYGNPVEKCFPTITHPNIGWCYNKNGTVSLHPNWSEKLRIVEELPFSLPTLPSGYKWLGDFPQFRVPVKGEHFIRYNSKTGFGSVAKCDGNFGVPVGEENRRLIVVPTEQESVAKQQVFVGEGYRRLNDEEYYNTSHECCKLSDVGTSREKWAKVLWSNKVSGCPEYVFREKVASQPKESVAVKPQPLSTEEMVEVSHLKDYILQKDDKYIECGKVYSAGELAAGPYKVKWFGSTVRLFATKKNYGDYVSKTSPPITEGPIIGAGYRKIDISLDTPQEGDQFWSQLDHRWNDRPLSYGDFSRVDTYRRLISNDWVILDPKIYGDCVPTKGHEFKKREHTKWEAMDCTSFHPIKHWEERGYIFRCKKANVPIVITLPINDRADAALISGVASASPLNKVPVQVQENEMSSNSSSSTETVKFETAKKLAVGAAKLGGKMIWRTADYFVFAPIKKAASPFMWMVRYAVLGTAVGGGVYACSNPDDAKELLWKCIPKISISIDAPEVLG